MIEIFDKYMDKQLDGDMLLTKAYSIIQGISEKWVSCNYNDTIQERIDCICDDLEKEGYSLEITPIDTVRDRFSNIVFSFEIPEEYKALKLSLDKARELEMIASGEVLISIQETIEKIEMRMKEYK